MRECIGAGNILVDKNNIKTSFNTNDNEQMFCSSLT